MPADILPAIPSVLPKVAASKARLDRLASGAALASAIVAAAVAVVIVAMSAVMLGLT